MKGAAYYLIDDKIHLLEDTFPSENAFNVNHKDQELLKGYTFLVVDDNPINLTVADKTLAKFGGKSYKCLNADDALKVFEREKIDLILMDLHMPNMNGFQATQLIQSSETYQERNIPILAYTTYSYNDVQADIEAAGMNGYIGKPFTHTQVINTITDAVGVQR